MRIYNLQAWQFLFYRLDHEFCFFILNREKEDHKKAFQKFQDDMEVELKKLEDNAQNKVHFKNKFLLL